MDLSETLKSNLHCDFHFFSSKIHSLDFFTKLYKNFIIIIAYFERKKSLDKTYFKKLNENFGLIEREPEAKKKKIVKEQNLTQSSFHIWNSLSIFNEFLK
jgi:hypothetical protein